MLVLGCPIKPTGHNLEMKQPVYNTNPSILDQSKHENMIEYINLNCTQEEAKVSWVKGHWDGDSLKKVYQPLTKFT